MDNRAGGVLAALLVAQLAQSAWQSSRPRSGLYLDTSPQGARVSRLVPQATLTAAGTVSAGLLKVAVGVTPGPLQLDRDDFRSRLTLSFELPGYHRLDHNFPPGRPPSGSLTLQPRIPLLVPALYVMRDYPWAALAGLGGVGLLTGRMLRRRRLRLAEAMMERLARGEFQPGDQVHGYVLSRILGRGGMGLVFGAVRVGEPDGEELALKLLVGQVDERARERFEREVSLSRTLQHPGLVFMLDWGEWAGRLYLVMELVPGRSLQDEVLASPPDLHTSLAWLHELASVLKFLHERGIVHRDLKPANVMVGPGGRLKLMDFGISTRSGEKSVGAVGSVGYSPPEQMAGGESDWRGDAYSLGVVAWFCLSAGRTPFTGAPLKILQLQAEGDPTSLQKVAPEVPPAVAAWVHRLLDPEPARRADSEEALLEDLERLQSL